MKKVGWYKQGGTGNWKNDKQEGFWKHYHKNGKLESEGNYKEGKHDGVWKTYSENGQLIKEENFLWREGGRSKYSQTHGSSKSWYENGQIMRECNYLKDRRHGLDKCYYENGQLEYEYNFKNEMCDGIFKTYHENGELIKEEIYKDDELISSKILNGEGPFYYHILEESWNGKEEIYMWCRVFRFRNEEDFNVINDYGYDINDETQIGEFYYNDSNEKYVKWSEMKDDFTKDGFLEIGGSIGEDEFEGKKSELLIYLRNKHGKDLRIDLISNMEPTK